MTTEQANDIFNAPSTLAEAERRLDTAKTELLRAPAPVRPSEWGSPEGVQYVDFSTGHVHTRPQYSARMRAEDEERHAKAVEHVRVCQRWVDVYRSVESNPDASRLMHTRAEMAETRRQIEELKARQKALAHAAFEDMKNLGLARREVPSSNNYAYLC